MTKKGFIRVLAFFLVLSIVFYLLCDLFESTNVLNRDQYFSLYRSLPEDTVDAVIIGTSGVDRYWIPAKAYENNGMVMCTLSTGAMPSWLCKNVVEEAYVHHNPKLIVIDIRPFTQSNPSQSVLDVRARRVIDSMPLFSANYIKTAFDSMRWIKKADSTASRIDISLLIPFVRYHTKWQDDDFLFEENFGDKIHEFGGYYLDPDCTAKIKKQKVVKYNSQETAKLDPISQEALYEFIDYVKEKNLNVLFVDTPQFRKSTEIGRANKVYEILEEEGMDFIHFYSDTAKSGFEISTLDPKTDFYDGGHVNFYGAQKFTDYFSEYIDEKYDLPDRRDQEEVKEYWDGVYDMLVDEVETYKKDK